MYFIILHNSVTIPRVHLSVEYRGYGLITSRKYVPNLPAVLGRLTVVWHLTKPRSRRHLGFLGVCSDTDPWRNGFLLQLHSSHTPTTKGCRFMVESDLRDLDENCPVCCEFVEVCLETCWHVEMLNEKCVLLQCCRGALEKSSQSQLMWKESGYVYIEKGLLSAIKVLPSWMLLINNRLVSLTALKFKIFTFYG